MSQPSPDWLVISPIAALAGAIGALISLRSIDSLTPRGRVVAVGGGCGCSIFLTPLISDGLYYWLDWAVLITPRGEAGIAFVLGLMGLSAVAEVTKALPALVSALRDGVIRLFGGGGGGRDR
jgi:hypothetical protein